MKETNPDVSLQGRKGRILPRLRKKQRCPFGVKRVKESADAGQLPSSVIDVVPAYGEKEVNERNLRCAD
eukprot:2294143-Rhodomonas_salina.1